MNNYLSIKNDEDRKIIFEQYKIITESLNKINDLRETANNFWTGLNAAIIGMIAYIRDAETFCNTQKPMLIFVVIFFGFIMSCSWLSYLSTIKKSVDIRNDILIEIEEILPLKFFKLTIDKMGRKEGYSSLSLKEMLVPLLFLTGYIFFGVIVVIYPEILLAEAP